jgi:hypothetical protein
MLTTIPNNNPHKRNRLIFKWLSGNDPCFVSLLGIICLNTGGHPSPPSLAAGGGEKTPPASRANSRFFPHKSPGKPRNRLISRGMRLLAFLLAIPRSRRKS